MEGELFNTMQKPTGAPQFLKQFPEISFIPPETTEDRLHHEKGFPEKGAIIGLVAGGFALVGWVVIVVGVLASIVGIIFSLSGLKSAHPKCARTGLIISTIGLIASFGYAFAAYSGMINYNYFTTEFWGNATSTAKK
jgi:hypothetical protein